MNYKIIYTLESKEKAKRLAKKLVEERLVACAGFFPLESIYWWEGRVQNNNEIGILIKTKESLVDEVIERIKELHSYQVPCICVWKIEKGNPDFLAWIGKETK